jgi:hypothetical protein
MRRPLLDAPVPPSSGVAGSWQRLKYWKTHSRFVLASGSLPGLTRPFPRYSVMPGHLTRSPTDQPYRSETPRLDGAAGRRT